MAERETRLQVEARNQELEGELPNPSLSKSRFQNGLQCLKRLYLETYHRGLADPVDAGRQAIFDTGTAVGEFARQRFPGGRLVEQCHVGHRQAVETTRSLLDDVSVPAIYEAGFTYESIRTRVDVLSRAGPDTFDLIEVKSTAGVKAEHYTDVAIQLYVVEGSGVPVNRAFLMHLNRDYVYQGGEHELHDLFALQDVTDTARSFLESAAASKLRDMWAVLQLESEPEVATGQHCTSPHRCSFYGYCHRDLVMDYGRAYVSDDLASALSEIKFPAAFLDFEAVNPAIPVYSETRPFQAIPFQWSLHILGPAGRVQHGSFLNDDPGDPRERLTTALLDALPPLGSIVTYSGYERRVVNGLADALPHYASLILALSERMVDLLAIVRGNVRHPEFRGSYSLKSVLPVLVPDMGYSDLEIAEGMTASASYLRMINENTPSSERTSIREGLLAYCALDTEAMVRIYEALFRESPLQRSL